MTDQQKASLKKVDKICRLIVELDEQDLLNVQNVANEQVWYSHPLKMASARRINIMGQGNLETVSKVGELRKLILDYKQKYKANKPVKV